MQTLRARRVLSAFRGSSWPVLVETDDRNLVVKLRGGAQGVLPLVAEMFVGRLADELGLSARALATRLGVPTNRITGVLNGSRSVTPDTALRLARFFGGDQDVAKFWLNLQQAYDLRCAELEAERDGYLDAIEPIRASAR